MISWRVSRSTEEAFGFVNMRSVITVKAQGGVDETANMGCRYYQEEPAVTGTRPQASPGVAEIRCDMGNRWIGTGLTEKPGPHGLLEMNSGSASAERSRQAVR